MPSIVVSGFARQGVHVARLLHANGAHARYYPDDRLSIVRSIAHAARADGAISIGGPPHAFVRKLCNARGRPAVVLWVGTDVLSFARAPGVLEPLRLQNLRHWSCAPHLVPELAALGIEARYVKIAGVPVCASPAPFPQTFTVLAYLPQPYRAFYGQRHLWDAARALPDARFIVVGEGGSEPGAPPNVHYAGEVNDVERRIDDACVLFRIPQHDGLPMMAIEALARGRHVIWTHSLPGAIRAASGREAIDALLKLYTEHREGRLGVNVDGMHYAAREHAPSDVARSILQALDEAAVTRQTKSAPRRRRSIAISGHDVFCARVASNCEKHSRDISASVLSTQTGGDTAVSILDLVNSSAWYTIGQPALPRAFELAAVLTRKRRLVHWLGNDVDALANDARLLRKYRSRRLVHLAQNEHVLARLNELGIAARIAPVAVLPQAGAIAPLPQSFTLLLYLPPERPEMYGRFQYERLMRSLAAEPLQYIIVGGGELDVPPGVCAQQCGWVHDLHETYDRCTALVRFTQNDPVSTMVLEALLHGRYVLCSNVFAGVTPVRNYRDLERSVRDLFAAHCAGALTPQNAAASAVAAEYGPERCVGALEHALDANAVYRITSHIESFTPGASRSERASGR